MQHRGLENSSEKLARLITATGTRVVFTPKVQGPMADIQNNLVLLPPLPEKMTPDETEKLQGAIDHEVAHLLFTKDVAGKAAPKAGGFEGAVQNALEDGRINRLMGRKYIGSQDNIKKLYEMSEVTTREMIAENKIDPTKDEFKAISALIKAATLFIWKRPDVAAGQGTEGDEFLRNMPQGLQEQLEAVETIEDVQRAAPPVMAWLKANRTPPPPQQSKGEGKPEKGDGQKQQSKGEGKGDGQGEGEGEGQGKGQGKGGKGKSKKQEPQDGEDEITANSMDGFNDDDEKDSDDSDESGDDEKDGEGEGESEGGKGSEGDEESEGEGDEEESEGDGEGEGDKDGEAEKGDSDGGGEGEGADGEEEGEEEGEGQGSGAGDNADGEMDGEDEEGVAARSGDAESLPVFTKEDDKKFGRTIEEMLKAMDDAAKLKLPSTMMDGITADPRTYSADTAGDIEQTVHELYTEVVGAGRDASFLKEWATDTFKDYKLHVGVLRARLVMDLQAKGKAWARDLRSGRGIDTSRLARPSVGDPRVFRQKIRQDKVDTAVTLLIDCSGSMSGSKIKTAMQLAALFTDALEMARVPCEVLGFTTHDDRPSAKFGVRSDGVRHMILKGFGETLAVTRDKWVAAFPVRNSNNDGESIMWAAKRLIRRKEQRKILLVLSDGYPAVGVRSESFEDHRQAYEMPYAYTKYAVKLATAAGIETLGIGIMSDAVKQFYPNWIQYNGLGDLMSGFYRTISGLLRTGKLQTFAA